MRPHKHLLTALRRYLRNAPKRREAKRLFGTNVPPEFRWFFGNEAMHALVTHYDFKSVLDIGSGSGKHSDIFRRHGKQVTEIDLGSSVYFAANQRTSDLVVVDYLRHDFPKAFDCIWASHVLEHQRSVGQFLDKVHKDLKEGGVLAITVPPRKDEIVGGHLSLWNAGQLLYNLVLARFNCRHAAVKSYAYNVSVIVRKETIDLPPLDMDAGDIERLAAFFPEDFGQGDCGVIESLNWPAAGSARR